MTTRRLAIVEQRKGRWEAVGLVKGELADTLTAATAAGAEGLMSELTPRERQVLEAVCRHGSNKAAAHALGRSEQTVKNTLSGVYRKLGADSAAQAAWLIWGPQSEHRYHSASPGVLQRTRP